MMEDHDRKGKKINLENISITIRLHWHIRLLMNIHALILSQLSCLCYYNFLLYSISITIHIFLYVNGPSTSDDINCFVYSLKSWILTLKIVCLKCNVITVNDLSSDIWVLCKLWQKCKKIEWNGFDATCNICQVLHDR